MKFSLLIALVLLSLKLLAQGPKDFALLNELGVQRVDITNSTDSIPYRHLTLKYRFGQKQIRVKWLNAESHKTVCLYERSGGVTSFSRCDKKTGIEVIRNSAGKKMKLTTNDPGVMYVYDERERLICRQYPNINQSSQKIFKIDSFYYNHGSQPVSYKKYLLAKDRTDSAHRFVAHEDVKFKYDSRRGKMGV